MPKITFGPDVDLDIEEVTLPSGRYTNADAEADSEHFTARAPGRPSLARGVSPQVTFRVPQLVKEALADAAKREGRAEAQIARQALIEYLERSRSACRRNRRPPAPTGRPRASAGRHPGPSRSPGDAAWASL